MTSGASRKIDGAKQRLAQQKRWSSLLSTIAELSKLAEQMATNLTLAETNAQQAIEARNVEMKRVSALRVDFEQERKLKDEAMKGKSELEADLKVGLGLIHQLTNDVVAIRKNAETALLDKSMDMEQMNKLVEQLEDENSDLKKKNKQLISDMQNAQAQFQSDEIKAVQNEADSLAGHVEKEVPRQDALEGKEGIESMLQMEPVTGVASVGQNSSSIAKINVHLDKIHGTYHWIGTDVDGCAIFEKEGTWKGQTVQFRISKYPSCYWYIGVYRRNHTGAPLTTLYRTFNCESQIPPQTGWQASMKDASPALKSRCESVGFRMFVVPIIGTFMLLAAMMYLKTMYCTLNTKLRDPP